MVMEELMLDPFGEGGVSALGQVPGAQGREAEGRGGDLWSVVKQEGSRL